MELKNNVVMIVKFIIIKNILKTVLFEVKIIMQLQKMVEHLINVISVINNRFLVVKNAVKDV
jgi:hypothetical protein